MPLRSLIVPIGPMRGGKGTFCKALEPEYATLSFADPLYAMLGVLVGKERVESARLLNDKEKPMEALGGKSLRHALQTLGTEWGREMIHQDLWRDKLFRVAQHLPKVAIDDLRFDSERIVAARKRAVFVRVMPEGFDLEEAKRNPEHASEAEWPHFPVHATCIWKTREEIVAFAEDIAANAERYRGTEAAL